jgi:molybdopterin converting factor small subunit
MATVQFAKAFRRHVPCPDERLDGATLRDVLDAYFAMHPGVRGYVLDELGALRRHINVFVNSTQCDDRVRLTDPIGPTDSVHVFQALSGG